MVILDPVGKWKIGQTQGCKVIAKIQKGISFLLQSSFQKSLWFMVGKREG